MSKDKTETEKGRNGLKVRRAEQAAPQPKAKPRKMNLVKPKRKSAENNMVNSALLVFPTDRLGLTTEIKTAMIKAASKIGKDADNLKLIDETLRICRGHIQARLKQNQQTPRLKQRVVTRPELEESPEKAVQGDEVVEAVDVAETKTEAPTGSKTPKKGNKKGKVETKDEKGDE